MEKKFPNYLLADRGVAYGLQLFLEYLKEKMLVVIIAHCAPSITYAALLRRLDWVN